MNKLDSKIRIESSVLDFRCSVKLKKASHNSPVRPCQLMLDVLYKISYIFNEVGNDWKSTEMVFFSDFYSRFKARFLLAQRTRCSLYIYWCPLIIIILIWVQFPSFSLQNILCAERLRQLPAHPWSQLSRQSPSMLTEHQIKKVSQLYICGLWENFPPLQRL